MKRFATLFFILFIFLCFNCKKEENTAIIKGLINFISGDVRIISADGNIRKATIGEEISQGMKISTKGGKSFVDIYIGNYIIKILGNTEIDIQKLFENIKDGTREVKLHVNKGDLFSRINTKLVKGDIYEVTTPTATAAVRGTEFLVSADDDGKSNIACLDGRVSVINNSLSGAEPVALEKHEETDVVSGKNMVKKQISADRLKRLNILLQIKEIRKEIRRKFENQKKEIKKFVEDQRVKNKEILDTQKEKNKAVVQDIRKTGKDNIDNIKDKTGKAAAEATDSAKKMIESLKAKKGSGSK